jgi:TonB family protein
MYEQLDSAVGALLKDHAVDVDRLEPTVGELLLLASDLRAVPSPAFRARLRSELNAAAETYDGVVRDEPSHAALIALPGGFPRRSREEILPTLFGSGYGNYPVHRSNFVVSAVLHACAVLIVLASSVWIARHPQQVKQQVVSLVGLSDYALPVSNQKSGGGGGGGDRDKVAAPKGTAPRFAREQITPPAIVIRNDNPKLAAEPTVIGPPNIKLPQSAMLGDPWSRIPGAPSNGTGSGSGIGSGSGGGVGAGVGPGVGLGVAGGIGGGIYRVGGGVSAPRVVYDPDPEYSQEARMAKHQGTVVLWVVIGPDGKAHEIKVSRALGMGLDEKAIEAVRNWRFLPAQKDGHPVAVQINVEVNFRLY